MVGAVVLAAGASSRFGSPKQRLLLPRVLERLHESPVDDIVVVTGAHTLETDARIVHCPDWERGPGASLRCGLAALPDDAEAAIVVLADGPNLSPEAVERVLSAWRQGGPGIYAASYDGSRSHPLLVTKPWPQIPDGGLRNAPVELVPCEDLPPPGDVDEPADL